MNNPRPKYDQQNSSNLNFCMNTTDPNVLVEQKKQEIAQQKDPKEKSSAIGGGGDAGAKSNDSASGQGQAGPRRVPPGGFSSGLW